MGKHPLESLIDLIEFDRHVIKQERDLKQVHDALANLEQSKIRRMREYNAMEARLLHAKKDVHEQENLMKELDEREKAKRVILETAKTQAMYDAAKKEINFLKKAQYDEERQLVQSWKMLELAQKTHDEYEASSKSVTQEIEQKELELKSHLVGLKAELDAAYQARTKKEALVPQEWLVKYCAMRAHTIDPIVCLEGDCCGGCFAQLPPQDLTDLRHKRLIQCSSCYRFIYIPEALMEAEGVQEDQLS